MRISADIKSLAARDTEIDVRRRDTLNRVAVNVNQAWFALHYFAFARQFVERDTALLDRGNHRRHLVKIAAKFFERRAYALLRERRHGLLLHDFSGAILRIGRGAERERAGVFFVLAHEQILDLGPASEREQKQAGGDRIERAAMADLLDLKPSPNECDDVVRRHARGFIDEQDAVRSCS